jgi:hypothetical protein
MFDLDWGGGVSKDHLLHRDALKGKIFGRIVMIATMESRSGRSH